MIDAHPQRLSERVGTPVLTHDGRRLGRVADLTVRLGPRRPPVHRLLVRAGRSGTYLVDWGDVAESSPTRVVLRSGARPRPVPARQVALAPDELLLARDVLDTQVFDLQGQRLSRVSEVLLSAPEEGPSVLAVDLGTAALLRRIGLGLLARGASPTPVAWADLHLTSQRGHQVQLSTEAASFRQLDAHGLAALLARLDTGKGADILDAADAARAAAAVHQSHPQTGRRLVGALSADGRRRLIRAATSSVAEVIEELGQPVSALRRRRFLRSAGWRLRRPPEG